ncbi:MAG: outer membrane lipoprotein carrier protein LolA [Acidimicrobiia bacterium]|nr:outer membrane lipoprotein carrier protein LolA [Acidimicrobiia bacterium]
MKLRLHFRASEKCSWMVSLLIIWACGIAGAQPPAADKQLEAALTGLQKKYSQVRDLRMEFIQSYKTQRRPAKTETGTLILKRPGKMRWEYKTPTEKLFVSNGKTVFFYLPHEKQLQKSKVKETHDQRIPFLFLLGKGNLKRDFSKVEWASDEKPFFQGNRVILAYPKKGIDEFARILMEFSPQTFQLQRVTVFDVDGAMSEFVFTGIQQDLGTAAGLFDFEAPPGTEVIESN